MADLETSLRVSIVAHSLYLANLLFVGVALLILVVVYRYYFKKVPQLMQNHLRHTLLAASVTTLVFLVFNLVIFAYVGYFTVTGLIMLEIYYMLLVPILVVPGILGLIRASKGRNYSYPIIGRLLS